jgi:hypothetical protein
MNKEDKEVIKELINAINDLNDMFKIVNQGLSVLEEEVTEMGEEICNIRKNNENEKGEKNSK